MCSTKARREIRVYECLLFCIYFGFQFCPFVASVATKSASATSATIDDGGGGKTQSNYYLCINRLIYSLIIYELFLVGPSEPLCGLSGSTRGCDSLARSRFQLVLAQRSPLTSRQLVSFDFDFVFFFSLFFCVFFFCGSSFVLFYIAYICIWIYISIYIYLHLCTRWFLCDFMQMKMFMFC